MKEVPQCCLMRKIVMQTIPVKVCKKNYIKIFEKLFVKPNHFFCAAIMQCSTRAGNMFLVTRYHVPKLTEICEQTTPKKISTKAFAMYVKIQQLAIVIQLPFSDVIVINYACRFHIAPAVKGTTAASHQKHSSITVNLTQLPPFQIL